MEHVDGVDVGGKGGLERKDLADALDTIRGHAMALGTGLLVGWRSTTPPTTPRAPAGWHRPPSTPPTPPGRATRLTEQGLVTGRYTTATEQLGSDKLDIRLGGIYALERIAADSARDHPTVMEVLATFGGSR